MVWLQDSILKHLHHHTLFNMLSNTIPKAHHAWILLYSGLNVGAWLMAQPIFLTFKLSSPIFSTLLQTRFKLPHPSITSLPQCVCTHPIDLINIHLLHCTHGKECIRTHDAIHDIFASIVWNASFHMGWKQLHVLPLVMFNSYCWQVKIMFTKNGIRTLANVVIVDPTHVDLLP
jgi:hypothetical protein